MPFVETGIPDLKVFEPKVWGDDRGYFFESYNYNVFKAAGIDTTFVQDNQSRSSYGVLRGLHYQIPPFAQAKLVRVTSGEVLDVAVDIRPDSPTYGQSYSIRLSAENKKQLFVPRGFAHGFVVLSETAEFFYKCDNFYSKESEGGLLFNDPQLKIDWQIELEKLVLSEKDRVNPLFGKHRTFAPA
ncbi:MAG: dTDP-4-dehydrorhamnose 3,5-epimerase [Saprospiraceae bacterium]